MLTGDPSTNAATTSPRRRVWPWAAGSILIPLLIISATLVGHRLAAQARLAAEVAPAPTLPPITVNAVTTARGQISTLTLDAHTQTLVATYVNATSARLSGVAFYDSVTGARKGESASPGETSGPFALTDTARGATYLVGAGGVTIFDDATGQRTSAYVNPSVTNAVAAGLDEQLGIIYTLDPSTSDPLTSAGTLNAFSASDGASIASVSLPAVSQLPPEQTPQIVVDASLGRVYAFLGGHNQPPLLVAYNASDLTPLRAWHVQTDTQFGSLDSTTHTLYIGRWDGSAWHIGSVAEPTSGAAGQTLTPQEIPALSGATRYGMESATGALVRMDNSGVTLSSSTAAAQPYAGLPLVRAPSVSLAMLPIDGERQLAYLPGDDNTILIVSLARPASHAAPNAITAALIARAGMTSLLPNTNQKPPFVSAQTFPLGIGTVSRQYYIHFADLGWKGPYAGTASVREGAPSGTPNLPVGHLAPGEYIMTLNMTWNQLFLRQHSWTVAVTPDGRTRLLSDSGDAIP